MPSRAWRVRRVPAGPFGAGPSFVPPSPTRAPLSPPPPHAQALFAEALQRLQREMPRACERRAAAGGTAPPAELLAALLEVPPSVLWGTLRREEAKEEGREEEANEEAKKVGKEEAKEEAKEEGKEEAEEEEGKEEEEAQRRRQQQLQLDGGDASAVSGGEDAL